MLDNIYKPKITQAAFDELTEELSTKGLLTHYDTTHYTIRLAIETSVLFLGSALLLFQGPSVATALAASVFLGVMKFRTGILGHDFSHEYGFKSKKLNMFMANLSWAFSGEGNRLWDKYHNRNHHVHCMNLNVDTFIMNPVTSNHRHYKGYPLIQKYKHILVWILIPLGGGFSMAIVSPLKSLFVKESYVWNLVSVCLLFVQLGFLWYLSSFDLLLSSLSLLLTLATGGLYYAIAFLPNHHAPDLEVLEEDTLWADQQIRTSQSIKGGTMMEAFLGPCLKYQIEHHLYPNVVGTKLRSISPYVKDFCKKNGYKYVERNLLNALYNVSVDLYQNRNVKKD